tara:strand:- start:1514 stop:2059 length:546 start_codon:yes stop_codon:yes gene_type:complete
MELSEPIITHPNNQRTIQALDNHYQLLLDSDVRYAEGRLVEKTNLFFIRKYKVDFSSGGRIYANIQNKPKTERLGLTIGLDRAGSLDISQLHPMLILRMAHGVDKELDGMFFQALHDAYAMPDYEDLSRGLHKKRIIALFNAPTEKSNVHALMSTHWWYDDITGELKVATYRGKKRRKGEP